MRIKETQEDLAEMCRLYGKMMILYPIRLILLLWFANKTYKVSANYRLFSDFFFEMINGD